MQLGMIGLGRMGANMVRRLMKDGHECVVYDHDPKAIAALAAEKATGSSSLDDFVARLKPPRAVWLMVPAAVVDQTLDLLAPKLAKGDAIIDGGNSYYIDDIRRAKALSATGIHYVDTGTSGGVWGLERGYCLMIGGPRPRCSASTRSSRRWRPGRGSVARTPGREKAGGTAEDGYLHCGPSGRRTLRQDGPQRHRVRPHGGVRRGLQHPAPRRRGPAPAHGRRRDDAAAQSRALPVRLRPRRTSPRSGGAAAWSPPGCSISTATALLEQPDLDDFSGRVSDSGEGRWTITAAIDEGVPAPRAEQRALRALRLARRGRLRQQGALGHALRVRRPRRASRGGLAPMPAPRSDALVFFGATGDLAYKKIFPALQPWSGAATSTCRSSASRSRAGRSSSSARAGPRQPRAATAAASTRPRSRKLAALLRYVDGDYDDPATFTGAPEGARRRHASRPLPRDPAEPLRRRRRRRSAHRAAPQDARVVVEKPFGRDLASARALNATLHAVFPESSIFRIDHYLGKEAVQNLLVFRFANTFLEPIWNRNYVESVQITMAESFGVAGPRQASTRRPAPSAT